MECWDYPQYIPGILILIVYFEVVTALLLHRGYTSISFAPVAVAFSPLKYKMQVLHSLVLGDTVQLWICTTRALNLYVHRLQQHLLS